MCLTLAATHLKARIDSNPIPAFPCVAFTRYKLYFRCLRNLTRHNTRPCINIMNLPLHFFRLPFLLSGCHEYVLSKHNMDHAILMHVLHLISKVLNLYFELPSFTEIFLPLTFNLQRYEEVVQWLLELILINNYPDCRLSHAVPGIKMQARDSCHSFQFWSFHECYSFRKYWAWWLGFCQQNHDQDIHYSFDKNLSLSYFTHQSLILCMLS